MLRFEQVSYTYPFQPQAAVQDISFSVQAGEMLLCTGASGCGKSTLIRLANGLCPHYYRGALHGEVLLNNVPIQSQTLAQIARQAGTLFQDPEQQFFALNVEDELSFALEWQGMPRLKMHHAVNTVTRHFGLEPLLDASLHQLSEGQKQKVGLAALCVQQPQVLILDEPSANLDPEATVALACHLHALKRQGMAILVVDHRLYWLEGVADRVLVMQEGRIAAEGDFAILHDADLRGRYGLRSATVRDVRHNLPDCRLAPEPVIQVDGLDFSHKNQPPLYTQGAFDLPAGITAFIGGNGCGKTTLARILAGLCVPVQGRIHVDGRICDPRHRLACTGIVLQNADHQLHMHSVLQEVQTALALATHAATEAHEAYTLLETFGLEHLAERHPQSLSGGEKQRLVIACALAKKPRLLILDEPTSGLDGGNMARLGAVLQSCADTGMCLALITHDLELLEHMCAHALRLPLSQLSQQ